MDLWAYCVCKGQWARVRESTMKPAGKPDAGNPHDRFDERGLGNGTAIRVSTRAQPRLCRRLFRTLEKLPTFEQSWNSVEMILDAADKSVYSLRTSFTLCNAKSLVAGGFERQLD